MKRNGLAVLMLGALATLATAAPPTAPAEVPPGPAAAPMYGHQLMTEQERAEQMARMRAVATEEEREQIRAEHHEQMQERARQQGIDLPDVPMARGGMGPGAGRGAGRW